MSDVTTADASEEELEASPETSAAADGDERLAYRGVFARLLVRPEIGAAIAAMSIWVFFWAVSTSFGLANGAASVLDVASTLGIMAVAVALLMIGGEFDLSSGAATGALGILTLLLVRDFTGEMGGLGLSLWIALPLSLLLALGLGWFNGTMVNRTSLPSFIVTLGSFFILKGAKLGFAKLIVDQIQVGKMDDLALNADARGGDKGYGFFDAIFAGEWVRNDHVWDGRDPVYTVATLVGFGLVVLAVYELRFARTSAMNPGGVIPFLLGLVGLVGGQLYLHATDSTVNNWIGGVIVAASIVLAGFGLALWRYEPLADRGDFNLDLSWLRWLGAGVVALVLAVVAATSLDAQATDNIYLLFTEQGIRAILFVALAAAGAVMLLMAANIAGRESQMMRSMVLLITAAATALMAFFIQSQSSSPKFRTEVFTVMLVVAAVMAAWAVVTYVFGERRFADAAADSLAQRILIAGVVAIIIGISTRLLFTSQAEIDAGISRTVFSVRTLWFLLFAVVCS
ncbi:MAG: hypothetical protein OER95_08415, partial [Acidimicrobiia bacterium]|nr:hypothetical protein [Acidimicrobiia bacterium]